MIDNSLDGASPKKVLDFLAQHDNNFRKEYSTVRGVYALYHAVDNSDILQFFNRNGPNFAIEIPFDQYIKSGKKDRLEIKLSI